MSGAVDELARQLRAYYDAAPPGRQVLSIHLFGIEHAAALQGVSKRIVLEQAGLQTSYITEINKGISLAEYVQVIKPLV